jgi:hypothetical protein
MAGPTGSCSDEPAEHREHVEQQAGAQQRDDPGQDEGLDRVDACHDECGDLVTHDAGAEIGTHGGAGGAGEHDAHDQRGEPPDLRQLVHAPEAVEGAEDLEEARCLHADRSERQREGCQHQGPEARTDGEAELVDELPAPAERGAYSAPDQMDGKQQHLPDLQDETGQALRHLTLLLRLGLLWRVQPRRRRSGRR